MAVKIPLNRFRSKFITLSANRTSHGEPVDTNYEAEANKFLKPQPGATPGLTLLYQAPDRRASIIVMGQIANTEVYDRTVTVAVCASGPADSVAEGYSRYVVYPIVKDFLIPANDARTFTSGRLVLEGVDFDQKQVPDKLVAFDTTLSAYNDTLLSQGITARSTGLVVALAVLDTVNTD